MAMPTRAVAYSAAPRRPWFDLLVIWDPRSEDGHRGNLQESHGRNPINETWSQHISSLASGENQTKLNEFPKKISHGRSVMPIRTCTLCRWVTRSCWNRLSLLSSGGCSRYGVFQWGRAASYSIAPCRTISMGNKSNGDVNYRTHTCAHLYVYIYMYIYIVIQIDRCICSHTHMTSFGRSHPGVPVPYSNSGQHPPQMTQLVGLATSIISSNCCRLNPQSYKIPSFPISQVIIEILISVWGSIPISSEVPSFFRLVVWNIFFFPYIGNVIIPTDELHHFSEG